MDDDDYLEITKMNEDDYRLFERIASALERIADSLAGGDITPVDPPNDFQTEFEWVAGKWYRTKCGPVEQCTSVDSPLIPGYPIETDGLLTYTLDGVFDETGDFDIVAGPFDSAEAARNG